MTTKLELVSGLITVMVDVFVGIMKFGIEIGTGLGKEPGEFVGVVKLRSAAIADGDKGTGVPMFKYNKPFKSFLAEGEFALVDEPEEQNR